MKKVTFAPGTVFHNRRSRQVHIDSLVVALQQLRAANPYDLWILATLKKALKKKALLGK